MKPNQIFKIIRSMLLGSLSIFCFVLSTHASNLVTASQYKPASENAVSQTTSVRFERITVEQGLSQNAVLTILQDQYGFMWFGTEDGLNKHDGYTFSIYEHDTEDMSSLSDNLVSKIYEDREGNLWVGTKNGLDRFDRKTETFSHFQHNPDDSSSLGGSWVVSIYEDSAGRFWVGTDDGGIAEFDRATGSFTNHQHDPENPLTVSSNSVRTIYEDRNGNLWVGTHGGLNQFDPNTGHFVRYQHDPKVPTSLSDDRVSAILEDSAGVLWIGTEGGGLNQFDSSSQTFLQYKNNPDDPNSLSHDRVRALFIDQRGRMWVGTQNGLDNFDSQQGRFRHYRHDPSDPYSLSSNSIWSIYEDKTGVLWFGTYGGGISKLSGARNKFGLYHHQPDDPNSLSDNMVWSLFEDQESSLWIGTFNGGLNKLNRETGDFTHYKHDPNEPSSLSSNDVRTILADHTGALWIGTSGALDLFIPQSETFKHYRLDPDDPKSPENRVIVLLEDSAGDLWVGTRSAGLNLFDRETGAFIRYSHDPDDPGSLSDNRVWSLHESRSGEIWVGTLGGINVLNKERTRFTKYIHDPQDPNSLSNDSIFSIHEDPSGAVWIGTWGGGLERFDPETQKFNHYTEKEGLPNNVIYGIEADYDGHLWLSTNLGLSKFDPQTETFHNFDISDGLQDNEFNVGAHFKSKTGELFFGGIRGFNAFFPEYISDNPHIPPIVITNFAKFNQTIRTNLFDNEHIDLSYKDNFISFEFAALDYSVPEKNQYAYMMEGQDEGWVDSGTRRYASYTNLKGGKYTFRVKGSNNDGIWNEEGVSLRITVTPPFWETWWFIGIIVVVVTGSVIAGVRFRVRSIEARSQELENLVDERTQEIEQRTRELETLYRADEELYRHLQVDEVLQSLVDIAVDILKADKSALFVWDERGEKLFVRAARGFKPETLSKMVFAPDEGIISIVAATGEPIIVEDTHQDSRVATRITEPEGIRSVMHFPIKIGGQVYGVFSADYSQPRGFGEDEQRLFSALAQRAASAIQNAQLYEAAQELAVVKERSRLARDLHDAVTQTLFSASLIAEVLPRIWERDTEQGQQRLAELRELTRGALAEMRTLLLELRPTALIEADLGELLRQLAESITGRARVPVNVKIQGECELPPDVKVAIYRIAQEALNNVAKHSMADTVEVNLHCEPGRIEMQIIDDGQGFNPSETSAESLGLGIMRERAEVIDAQLNIMSEIGEGTTIEVLWQMQLDDK